MTTARRIYLWLCASVIALMAATLILAPAATAQEKSDKKDEGKKEEKKEGLTLKPERTIEFTTDEGTWLSVDVSPDGQTLVLELLGDLYTLPIAGGQAKPLTTGMAFDSQPRFSPDGKWIAFLSDRDGAENLWIMKADGTEPKKLSDDKGAEFASPNWTPDSQYVVVSRTAWGLRTFELWEYHVQGGSGVQLTKAKRRDDTPNNERHNALGAMFSPDGRYLYYARKQGGFTYNLNFPQWQIARRDMITGDEDILTQDLGSAIRPLLSPDGNWLVYGTRYETQTGLRLRNLKTGEDRWLRYPVQRDDQESRFTRDTLPGYAFTPDGKEIVLTYGGKLHRLSIATGEAREIPFTATIKQELGPRLNFPKRVEEGPVRLRILQDPSQSPDGKRLAFSALTKIYVMDVPGGSPRRLTSGNAREYQPAWSPDGQWLAYVTWSEEGGCLWKMRADGSGQPVKLNPTAAFYADPVWSPDGSKIVALRGSAYERIVRPSDFGQVRGMDLIWIPANGGEAKEIIPARGFGKPHFGRDSERVYVYADDGLISLRLDGTDRRNHLKVVGPGLYAAERPVPADDIRISPDGHWAMALASNHLYVLAVPPVGGDAPSVDITKPTVPLKRLTEVGADYFQWADGGKTLTWAVGASFFRQPFDTVKFEKPKKEEKKDEKKDAKEGEAKEPAKEEAKKEEKEKPAYEEIAVVLELPRHKPAGTLVLRGARAIIMKGDEVLENADIVVTDNRIAAIGARGRVKLPAAARVFDVRGKTIVPGFIDTHAHWFEIRRGILDVQNWSFLANLAFGVTGGLDVQTATNDMFAYQDLVDTGEILGLRAYSTGPGIFSDNAFKSLDEVKGVLTKYKKYYRTGNLKSYLVGNRQQRQWMVEASKELEMMPTTEGALDLKLDLTHAIDGFTGNEHSLPIVPLYKDVVELYARSGIGYTPTLLVSYGGPWAENFYYATTEVHDNTRLARFTPHNLLDQKTKRRQWFRPDEYAYPQTAASAAKIIRAGGRVGIGSHGQLQGLGYHWELWSLAQGGLKPLEALRAATLHGAEIIGYAQDLGSLEPGKLADLIVLDKNPLDDIKNTNSVRYVMMNGELFEAETLKQLWPVEKELAPLWWWKAGPAKK
ncbi:MAG TPA: amidohydrolase family protein [Candidatus Xenobia bacterium]|nr:amidohydrolase family protein [Candidatus Xenobia bacterium]